MIKAAHKKVQRESFVRYVPEVIDTPQEEIEAEAYARQMRPDCTFLRTGFAPMAKRSNAKPSLRRLDILKTVRKAGGLMPSRPFRNRSKYSRKNKHKKPLD